MLMLDVEQVDAMGLAGPGGHCNLLDLLRTASNADGTSTCVLGLQHFHKLGASDNILTLLRQMKLQKRMQLGHQP
jgi:hypothetical protein